MVRSGDYYLFETDSEEEAEEEEEKKDDDPPKKSAFQVVIFWLQSGKCCDSPKEILRRRTWLWMSFFTK